MANNAIIYMYILTVSSLDIPLETRVNKFWKKKIFSLDRSQSDDYIRTCTSN